jgi:DNA-binding LacI/PurR family transcriptional regulator
VEKRSTIKDVAKEAGYSISVVSYVLNNTEGISISEETRAKIFQAAKKLNYVPNRVASGLRRSIIRNIGVVCYWPFDNFVANEFLSGIISAASDNSFRIVICDTAAKNTKYSYLDNYRDNTIDGVIFIPPYAQYGAFDEREHIDVLLKEKIPFVVLNGRKEYPDVTSVNLNYADASKAAVDYYVKNGYEEIVYVVDEIYGRAMQTRLKGYQDAMVLHGLRPDICLFSEAVEELDTFHAVIADFSATAQKILKETYKRNIPVPATFRLIAGNTETYNEVFVPAISSVMLPAKEIAEQATEKLIGKIMHSKENEYPINGCQVIIRET